MGVFYPKGVTAPSKCVGGRPAARCWGKRIDHSLPTIVKLEVAVHFIWGSHYGAAAAIVAAAAGVSCGSNTRANVMTWKQAIGQDMEGAAALPTPSYIPAPSGRK